MELITYNGVELPTEDELFNAIISCESAGSEELSNLKSLLYASTRSFIKACEKYEELEYRDDPEFLAQNLQLLFSYNGGLLGLADAILRRTEATTYISLIEQSAAKGEKKLSDTALKYYVDQTSAGLRGVLKALNEKQKSIQDKTEIQRGKLYRR